MNKVQLFQDRILTDAEQLALATGAAAYRWEDLTKAPVSTAMLRKESRWSGVSSVPDIGERVQPSADVGAGNVTAYFVDNGRLGVLARLELYPNKDSPDFHFLGHELCLGSPRPKPITA